MKRNFTDSYLIMIIFLILILGCNFSMKPHYYKDDLKLAKPIPSEIIKLYNDKKGIEIYNSLHPKIKEQIGKEDFEKTIKQAHEELGEINKIKLEHSKVKLFGHKERIVHFLYSVSFSKSNSFLHIAVITNDDNEAKLSGFNVYETENVNELIKELERN